MNGKNLSHIILLLFAVAVTTVFSFQDVLAQQVWNVGLDITVKIKVCGNGIKEEPEQCDRDDLGGQSCQGLGYYGGALTCTSACTLDVSNCSTVPPAALRPPEVLLPVVETKVVIEGKAYPEAEITLLSDGKLIAAKKADSSANFKFEITDTTPGIYTFSLWANDSSGRKSAAFSFTANITKDVTTTVSGILLPPTIELGKTALKKGDFLNISGQSFPESEVSIYIGQEIIGKTKAGTNGKWFYSFDTSVLDEGTYPVKVKAISPEGFISSFSQVLVFYFEKIPVEEKVCLRGDLNQDGKVNLVDFSILLHWWGRANACADQNGDGIVNLPDFSIMMYYWTG